MNEIVAGGFGDNEVEAGFSQKTFQVGFGVGKVEAGLALKGNEEIFYIFHFIF